MSVWMEAWGPMPGGRSEVFRERWMRNGTPVRRAGLVEEQAAPRSAALRGENIVSVAAGQGDLDGRGFGAVTEPVRMVSGCGRPLHRGGSARKGFWTPIRSPVAAAFPGRTGGRGRSVSKPPCGPIRSGPIPRGTFAAGAGSIRLGLAHRMRPRRNPCPQTRNRDRSSAAGECPNIPPNKTRSDVALGVKSTPTTATPTPTTAISCRRRLNRPRRPYLRLQNPKNEGLWSM